MREPLPAERRSITKTFRINGDSPFHLTVGFFDDGRVGELMAFDCRMGNTEHALLEAVLTAMSIGLQSGADLKQFTDKFRGMIFAPRGFTGDEAYPSVSSRLDYMARWLADKFIPPQAA